MPKRSSQTKENRGNKKYKTNSRPGYFYNTTPSSPVLTCFFRLYMYTDEKALFSILRSGKLRLSLPWNTNDVTECVAQKATEQSEGVKRYGYLCFSKNPHSPVMWGQYANRCKGACLAFDFEIDTIENAQPETYRILDRGTFSYGDTLIHAIEYERNRLPAASKQEEPFDISFFFKKSKEWEYEQEYRILYRLGDDSRISTHKDDDSEMPKFYVKGILSHLSAILLGTQFPHEIQEVIAEMRENVKASNLRNEELGYTPEKIKVMRLMHDKKTFSFTSEIDFRPSPSKSIEDKTIRHFLTHKWQKADIEYDYAFESLTGENFNKEAAYFLRIAENESYYILKTDNTGKENKFHFFRRTQDNDTRIVKVLHPQLMEMIFQHAAKSATPESK